MSMLSKLNIFKRDETTVKCVKKSGSIPISTKNKFLKIIAWLLMILPLIFSLVLFFKSSSILLKISKDSKTLKHVNETVSLLMQTSFEPKLEIFTDNFIDLYMTTPDDNVEMSKYEQEFRKYYAENFYSNSTSEFGYVNGVSRHLLYKKFYEMKSLKNDVYDISYIVSYELKGSKKENDKVEEVAITNTMLLHIPIYVKNHQYSVVDYPYFTPLENNQATFKGLENHLNLDEAKIDQQAFKVYLDDFFKKYASLKPSDMAYIMKDPSSLNNEREFVEVKVFKVFENKDKTLLVKALVRFKDKEIDYSNLETYTLTVSKKDNKYFVDKLEHIR